MYDSSHGATQVDTGGTSAFNIELEYIIKPRWHKAWMGAWDLGAGTRKGRSWLWGRLI